MKVIIPARMSAARLSLGLGVLAATALHAQTTYTWTGLDADGNWSTAANWSPGTAAPGALATDIARFNAADASPAVTLGSPTTIGRLLFESGASAYTLSGSALTISGAGGAGTPTAANALVSHTAGNTQTISAPLTLALTTATNNFGVNVGSVGALSVGAVTLSGGTSFSSNLFLIGGGTLNVTGAVAASGFTLNQIQSTGGSTLNFAAGSSLGGGELWASGGNINIGINHNRTMQFAGTGGQIYLTGAVTTSGSLRFRPAAGGTATFGANIAGGGTATHSGDVRFSSAAQIANATFGLDAKAGSTLVLSGQVLDTNAPGAGTRVSVTGAGVVRFSGATSNTSVTPVVVDGGTLELAKTGGATAIAGGSVTVQNGGTLRLAAANQIADTVSLALGGAFNTGGFSETLGVLSLTAASTIDLGAGASALAFANSSGATWASSVILSFVGFTEGVDTIRFGTGAGGLTELQLSQITINGLAADIDANGFLSISAIPEPSSYAALAGAGALALCLVSRRRSRP